MKFDKTYDTFVKDKDGKLVGKSKATKPAKSKLPELPKTPAKDNKTKGGK